MRETREKENFEKQLNKRKASKVLQWFSLVLFVGILIVVLVILNDKKVFTTYVEVSSSESQYISGNEILKFGDYILFYNNDGIKCVKADGTKVWDVVYQMQEPIVVIHGDKVVVADIGGTKIYLMDYEGKISEIPTDLTIKSIEVSESGMVAAVLDGNDVTWMYIYGEDGTVLLSFRMTMDQTGYPMAISMSPNGKVFSASYLGLANGELNTSIAFYNFGEVGSNYTDRYVSGYNYVDMLIPVLEFMDDEYAVAVANDRIMFYYGSEKPTMLKEVLINQEIQSVYIGSEAVALVFKNVSAEGDNYITLYSKKGEVLLQKGTDFDFVDVEIENDLITMYNQSECLVWSFSGDEKYSGGIGANVLKMFTTSDKYSYNIVTEDEVKVVELR
ncbi:MAG: DUF5711 family protein [Lachnospiraceae bacterium]